MPIDPKKTYEIHRPEAVANAAAVEAMTKRLFDEETFRKFLESRDRAGTAGPVVIDGNVASMPGEKVAQLFEKALTEGTRPCEVADNGNVLVGEYVFAPAPD